MRRLALLCSAALFAACTKSESPPVTDTTVAPVAEAPAPAAITAADVAGKWAVTGKYEGEDTTIVRYDLTATADTTGWTMTFPNRAPVPIRTVSISGDSIVTDAGPYPSAVRKGVQVTTHGVFRVQDGKLVGRTVARYAQKGPDTLRIVIAEGVRK